MTLGELAAGCNSSTSTAPNAPRHHALSLGNANAPTSGYMTAGRAPSDPPKALRETVKLKSIMTTAPSCCLNRSPKLAWSGSKTAEKEAKWFGQALVVDHRFANPLNRLHGLLRAQRKPVSPTRMRLSHREPLR